MAQTIDRIELKQKLGFNLAGSDLDVQFGTVMYMAYKTLEANHKMTVKKLKALLCVEYLISETVIDGVLATLVSRSMFACVKRWRDPERPVCDMSLSVVVPVPVDFVDWQARITLKYPELTIFVPPIYQHKDCRSASSETI